jgi:hypothetical protein
MIDLVRSELVRAPTPWEIAKYRSASKVDRETWSQMFDEGHALRWDDGSVRAMDNIERRWCSPAPSVVLSGPRPSVFRSLFVADAAGKDSWFDGDYVLSDGATKLYGWTDYADASHYLLQATGASQCLLPVADAAFANAKCASFNGTSHTYSSTRAGSAFKYMHDLSAVEIVSVYSIGDTASNHVFWSTWGNPGAWHYANVSGFPYFQTNQDGAASVLSFSGISANVLNVPTYTSFQAAAADTPDAQVFRKSTQIHNGNAATTPSTSAPPQSLRMGNLGAATANWFNGKARALYVWRRTLDLAQKTVYRAWIQRDTGILP